MHANRPPPATTHSQLRVSVASQHSYDVVHAPGLLARFGPLLRAAIGDQRIALVSDNRIRDLYGTALERTLHDAGIAPRWILVPEGELAKTMEVMQQVLSEMLQLGLDRRSVLVNFGGGAICDLGGFAASCHLRGIRYVNFATSVIAQVDAAVGGKVAVNLAAGKNLVGAFHHPCLVAADAELLQTLGNRDFNSGIAEVIKVAIIDSPDLFGMLRRDRAALQQRDPQHLSRMTGLAAGHKMRLVDIDPYEEDLRRSLNLGHTLGHPIETNFAYRGVRHGEAVAVGIALATLLAHRRGLLAVTDAEAVLDTLERYELLGCTDPLNPTTILQHLRSVRLVRARELHFVLPIRIGGVHITSDLGDGELVEAFEAYESLVQRRRNGGAWELQA